MLQPRALTFTIRGNVLLLVSIEPTFLVLLFLKIVHSHLYIPQAFTFSAATPADDTVSLSGSKRRRLSERKRPENSTSRFRGVTHHIRTGRWESHIWKVHVRIEGLLLAFFPGALRSGFQYLVFDEECFFKWIRYNRNGLEQSFEQ